MPLSFISVFEFESSQFTSCSYIHNEFLLNNIYYFGDLNFAISGFLKTINNLYESKRKKENLESMIPSCLFIFYLKMYDLELSMPSYTQTAKHKH